MKKFIFIVAATLSLVGFAEQASATCRWTFVNGHQQQLCDSTIDMPAIRPPGIAPIVPPSIAPIQRPVIPPLGTSSCHQAQVWNGSAYQWQTVCQ
jgi:hypothetical protein